MDSSSKLEMTPSSERRSIQELAARFYESEPHQVVQAEFAGRSHAGKVRQNNEDQYLVVRRRRERDVVCSSVPDELFANDPQHAYTAAVADGIGGHRFGDIASLLAMMVGWQLGGNEIKWVLKTNPRERGEMRAKATVFVQLIHQALLDHARANPRLRGMGTTLTLTYSVGAELYVIHVGDSRAYLYRNGVIQRLTTDHTLSQILIDTGQVPRGSPEERRVRNVVTNSLGVPEGDVYVEFGVHELADGDRVLLCTDGLTDLVEDDELGPVLDRHSSPAGACQALVDLALERGGVDNVTVVVGRYEIPPDSPQSSSRTQAVHESETL